MLFSRNVARNGTHLSILERENSCATYHFRIKVENVHMVYYQMSNESFCEETLEERIHFENFISNRTVIKTIFLDYSKCSKLSSRLMTSFNLLNLRNTITKGHNRWRIKGTSQIEWGQNTSVEECRMTYFNLAVSLILSLIIQTVWSFSPILLSYSTTSS